MESVLVCSLIFVLGMGPMNMVQVPSSPKIWKYSMYCWAIWAQFFLLTLRTDYVASTSIYSYLCLIYNSLLGFRVFECWWWWRGSWIRWFYAQCWRNPVSWEQWLVFPYQVFCFLIHYLPKGNWINNVFFKC